MKSTKRLAVGRYVVSDPEICHGQLTFLGTRILVESVLSYLADGRSIEWALEEWPRLSRAAVQEALHLAAGALVKQYHKAA